MNVWEALFLIQLFAVLGIAGFKFYNLSHKGQKSSMQLSIILFCGLLISWFMGLVIFLNNVTEKVYIPFFHLENLFLLLGVIFFIGEVLINLGVISVEKIPDYRNPLAQK